MQRKAERVMKEPSKRDKATVKGREIVSDRLRRSRTTSTMKSMAPPPTTAPRITAVLPTVTKRNDLNKKIGPILHHAYIIPNISLKCIIM